MKKPEKIKRPRGRPSDYKPEYAQTAFKLCSILGATDKEVAEFFGKDVSTINRWKLEHADFCASIKLSKDAPDDRVEKSLYHRALGYSHPAVKIFANPKTGENVKVDYIEHYPPDTAAAIFWLKNRRKDTWQNENKEEYTPEQLISFLPLSEINTDEHGPDSPIL